MFEDIPEDYIDDKIITHMVTNQVDWDDED